MHQLQLNIQLYTNWGIQLAEFLLENNGYIMNT